MPFGRAFVRVPYLFFFYIFVAIRPFHNVGIDARLPNLTDATLTDVKRVELHLSLFHARMRGI